MKKETGIWRRMTENDWNDGEEGRRRMTEDNLGKDLSTRQK